MPFTQASLLKNYLMNWLRRADLSLNLKASQVMKIIWLAFTLFSTGLALAGIPHYWDLLRSPCDFPHCLGMQMSETAARDWIASGLTMAFYANIQLVVLLMMSSLLLVTSGYLIVRYAKPAPNQLAAFIAVALATSTLAQAQASIDPLYRLPARIIFFVQMAGLLPLFYLFPDGSLQPRWMRWIATGAIFLNLVYLFPQQVWLAAASPFRTAWLVLMGLAWLVTLANFVVRLRRTAGSTQYEQMLWILAGLLMVLPLVLLNVPVPFIDLTPVNIAFLKTGAVSILIWLMLAIGSFTCILVALVNYEPVDFKIVASRTLVYLALTAFLFAAYGLVVGYLSNVFHSENVLFSLIATGLIAVLFQPLRHRLQLGVNRLIYGERDNPYQVIAKLGLQLESAMDPIASLALAVDTIAQALKLPYVAISYFSVGKKNLAASSGSPQVPVICFPLTFAGETIGELLVSQRAGNEAFSDMDRRLLADLARQISPIAHATLLSAELQAARLRIVDAREETRRRLGSDLHDGIGHQLTGLARKTEQAARQAKAEDPETAAQTLTEITQQLNATIAQVRALAHQLHPPELETLGLIEALREQSQAHPGLSIRLAAPGILPILPAAVETAVYYIALEAMTNIEKHAEAQTCQICLSIDPPSLPNLAVLTLEISDDGVGMPDSMRDGLGLLSMQGRAAEVGGTSQVVHNASGGTTVRIRIPFQPVSRGE